MNRYHDKRRRIEYVKIKKMLNLETSENSQSQSSIDSENEQFDSQGKRIKPDPCPPGCENLLGNLHFTTIATE